MKLTPEDFQKLEVKKVANIIRKLNSGKTLTAREETILAQVRASDGEEAAKAVTQGSYVKTWDELADACNIDRRTLTNVRDRFSKEIKIEKKRLQRADGRHCVIEWIKFLDQRGVKGRGVNNPDSTLTDEKAIRLKQSLLNLARDEWKFLQEKKRMLACDQFEIALVRTVAAFNSALEAFGMRVNEQLEGRDFNERAAVIEAEVELLKKTLSNCDYLTPEEEDDDE